MFFKEGAYVECWTTPVCRRAVWSKMLDGFVCRRVPTPPTFGNNKLSSSSAPRQYVELTSLDSLVGLSGRKNLLGMLTQREEGIFYLEDLNGNIRLNLQNVKPTAGLFTEAQHSIPDRLAQGSDC